MDYDQALKRLTNHANLPNELPEEESLGYALWQIERTGQPSKITELCDDVIECLEVINVCINGSVPSETFKPAIDGKLAYSVDGQLAYSVACIITSAITALAICSERGQYDPSFIEELRIVGWKIAVAWECVLAGDIDSLRKEINYGIPWRP